MIDSIFSEQIEGWKAVFYLTLTFVPIYLHHFSGRYPFQMLRIFLDKEDEQNEPLKIEIKISGLNLITF
jgi:hypothetical protein